MIEYKNEDDEWHRVNGAAREWDDGDYMWYYNGQLHRYYGPAWYWIGDYEHWIFGEWVK